MANKPMQFAILRLALSSGVLAFGGVSWVLSRQGPMGPVPPPQALTWAAWGVWGTALAVLLVWRLARTQQVERGDLTSLLVGWAVGEVPALFGAAYLLLTADPTLLLAGLVIFAAALLLFPAPRQRNGRG